MSSRLLPTAVLALLAMLVVTGVVNAQEKKEGAAISTLMALSGSDPSEYNSPPRIIIQNGLPNGYLIKNAGCAFYYRRNQNRDPEVVTEENVNIQPGQEITIRGTRRDCCRIAIVGIDVLTPSGREVPVFETLTAPDGECIVQEVLRLEPAKLSDKDGGLSVITLTRSKKTDEGSKREKSK